MPKEDTQFKKGKSGNPNGRPKKPRDVLQIQKDSSADLVRKINTYINKSVEELQKIAKDKSTLAWDLMLISAILKGIKTGDMQRIETILNRLVGKVTDKVEHSGSLDIHSQLLRLTKEYVDKED